MSDNKKHVRYYSWSGRLWVFKTLNNKLQIGVVAYDRKEATKKAKKYGNCKKLKLRYYRNDLYTKVFDEAVDF